jgi:hypothetical protein
MKKFLEIYLGFFIGIPLALCIIAYVLGCFITWSIIEINIEWAYVRLYMVLTAIISFFLSMEE